MRAYEWLAGKLRRKVPADTVRLLAKSAEIHRRDVERAREEGRAEVRRELRQEVRDVLMRQCEEPAMTQAWLLDKLRFDVGLLFCEDDASRTEWVKFVKEYRAAVNDLEFERLQQAIHGTEGYYPLIHARSY